IDDYLQSGYPPAAAPHGSEQCGTGEIIHELTPIAPRDTGYPVRRGNRYGRRLESAGAEKRTHGYAMVRQSKRRLLRRCTPSYAVSAHPKRSFFISTHQRG